MGNRPSSCKIKVVELTDAMNVVGIGSYKDLCTMAGTSTGLITDAIRNRKSIISGRAAVKILNVLGVPFDAVFSRVQRTDWQKEIKEAEGEPGEELDDEMEEENDPETLHCVYKHTFPDGKVYIGRTVSGNAEKRWNHGLGYKTQKKVFRAIIMYGWDNIKHEILEDNIPSDQIADRERHYIAYYDSVKDGYNVKGDLPFPMPTREELERFVPSMIVLGYSTFPEFLEDFFKDLDEWCENHPLGKDDEDE